MQQLSYSRDEQTESREAGKQSSERVSEEREESKKKESLIIPSPVDCTLNRLFIHKPPRPCGHGGQKSLASRECE